MPGMLVFLLKTSRSSWKREKGMEERKPISTLEDGFELMNCQNFGLL